MIFVLFSSCIQYEALVVEVIDGDTMKVYIDEKVEFVRILGIDCPEIKLEKNRPEKFENISAENLTYWAFVAKNFTKNLVEGKRIKFSYDHFSDKRDQYNRILAYVYVDGVDVGSEIIKNGLARVYVEAEFLKMREYLKLQDEAKKRKAGLWSELK
ncbi:MAG: thermonuclease family protein [Archaeoglobaceae archaeon]|nr:thermonuclease family protein [Archaeoglobaceae archaeon]MCX8151674.1 thermonuclease family protein [Archaeoglobaceae archaeon]MDW8013048.1 thermonuclease family protein [Archaeoglobaceae archaeon]